MVIPSRPQQLTLSSSKLLDFLFIFIFLKSQEFGPFLNIEKLLLCHACYLQERYPPQAWR